MATDAQTLRQVIDSGQVLVMGAGPGSAAVSLVAWDRAQTFTVWMSLDGCNWVTTHVLTYAPDDWRDAQEWAAHRLHRAMSDPPH